MRSVPVDKNDKSKGFYYVWDDEEDNKQEKFRELNDITIIWICFQLSIEKTYKQIERKLKVYSLNQIKNASDRPYEDSNNSYFQWWVEPFLIYRRYIKEDLIKSDRGLFEFYRARTDDLELFQEEILEKLEEVNSQLLEVKYKLIKPSTIYTENKKQYEADLEKLREIKEILDEIYFGYQS